ncbi:MAG TPA: transcriptional regulator GcvA [Rhodocyclaceae bacterium]|nr:transcriptional regulator GcvA [Rhodocyclaceae bacterium]
MSERLPPLNSLRAFEAAARHLSFRKAAEELHVTPAAISHQIKLLEDQLDVALFRRLTRAIELTEVGRSFLPKLREGFDAIAQAVERVRAHGRADALTVNVPPSFATKWLMPRLHRFVTANPDIDIRILASMRLMDASRRDFPEEQTVDADIDIRFGTGRYPHSRVDLLFPVSLTPLCSPSLLKGMRPLSKPADLRYHVLLHDDTLYLSDERPDWEQWLRAAGVDSVDPSRGPHFNHSILGLEAAVDGLGVVLGVKELAAHDLAAGRLVAPFELSLAMKSAYYLVSAETSAERPKVVVFRNWLLEEAKDPMVRGSA